VTTAVSAQSAATRPGVIAGPEHQGGLRADIVTEGAIRLGDLIAASGCSHSPPHRGGRTGPL
jgi:hypothetical protein